jgi:hypothetical protein
VKISKKKLKTIVENFLREFPEIDRPANGGFGSSSSPDEEDSRFKGAREMLDAPKKRAAKTGKYKTAQEAFDKGKLSGEYSIPELALLWYQSVGRGRDLNFFGDMGEFNNHPDAGAFKKIILEICKPLFETESFNIILDNEVKNSIIITASNTYGNEYKSKTHIINILRDIVNGENKNIKDHVMVTLGQCGAGGKQLIAGDASPDEAIINPNQNNGVLKIVNPYDFGFVFSAISSFANVKDIQWYGKNPVSYSMIIEINAPNFPMDEEAPLSKSGLKTGDALYKLAAKNNLKAGDKVK